ncbi:hypothetical protein [Halorubrum ezzemoulense]|uniref:Uncharacterized protein n=1 Tax=Halorubrum ezzemoulense TaxID=337243 RepID=A0A256JRT1_HALEZ|nr:hypothetical protein [Halorubrum ezzemoulense]OYR71578.1 hypothetical protein DJ78_05025 [Halorubrum ezzemoulense]
MTGGYASAKAGDHARDDETEVRPIVGRVDDPATRELLNHYAGLFDSEDQFLESELAEQILRTEATNRMDRAVREGAVNELEAMMGLSESSVEATGYDMLLSRVKPAAQQILIKGEKGSGKTVMALDIARQLYTDMDGELKVATNIRGPNNHDAVSYRDSMSGMLEWVRETPGEKLLIGDEWSSEMNTHAVPGGDVRQTVSQFINALRKGEGGSTRLLVIGHQHDTDIAKILRVQSDLVVQKAGKADEGLADRAYLYDSWQDYQTGDEALTLRGLSDVIESSPWGADTNYFATFDLDLDSPREQIQKGKLVEDWQQYQDDAEGGDDAEPDRIVCRGTKSGGDDCQQLTRHESGFCAHHRPQWDGDTDPRRADS